MTSPDETETISPDGEQAAGGDGAIVEILDAEVIDAPDVLSGEGDELGLSEADDVGGTDEPQVLEAQEAGTSLAVSTRSGVPEQVSALNIYLARLKDVEILPIEEQNELARRYQESGDAEAAARLVASNLRLVVKIAFQFRRQWADIMDIIAEGNLGLSEAIRKFDADRGVPFPSYARFWIRARILAFIQENKHVVHAGSRAARKLFWRLERERRALQQEGLTATPKRLAERVGVEPKDVEELAPILDQRAMSMDAPARIGMEEGRSRGDGMTDDRVSDPEELAGESNMQELLRGAFSRFRQTLNERDQQIWDERLQSEEPLRLEDLGERFGVSKERVRQLEVRIKKRLKVFLEEELGDEVIIEALN